jgi:methylglyoxal synthase
MRLCDVRNIPLATNKTSAAIMLKALSDGDIAEAEKDN